MSDVSGRNIFVKKINIRSGDKTDQIPYEFKRLGKKYAQARDDGSVLNEGSAHSTQANKKSGSYNLRENTCAEKEGNHHGI